MLPSQNVLTVFMGVVAFCYQHHAVMLIPLTRFLCVVIVIIFYCMDLAASIQKFLTELDFDTVLLLERFVNVNLDAS